MANERYQQNSHKWQTWDLRWQLGFQWHRRGIELVLQVPSLFHSATFSQCDHFLLLHMYMYLLFEISPGWLPGWRVVFFKLNLVGGTQLQCIYYLCRILISRLPRVFRRFKRRSCWLMHWPNEMYIFLFLENNYKTKKILFLKSSDMVILHVNTFHLCRESTDHKWIPLSQSTMQSFDVFFVASLN